MEKGIVEHFILCEIYRARQEIQRHRPSVEGGGGGGVMRSNRVKGSVRADSQRGNVAVIRQQPC